MYEGYQKMKKFYSVERMVIAWSMRMETYLCFADFVSLPKAI